MKKKELYNATIHHVNVNQLSSSGTASIDVPKSLLEKYIYSKYLPKKGTSKGFYTKNMPRRNSNFSVIIGIRVSKGE